jgi:hypothetical protein
MRHREGKNISLKCETALVAVENLDDKWGNIRRSMQISSTENIGQCQRKQLNCGLVKNEEFMGERKQAELTWKQDASYIIADSLNNVGCESS